MRWPVETGLKFSGHALLWDFGPWGRASRPLHPGHALSWQDEGWPVRTGLKNPGQTPAWVFRLCWRRRGAFRPGYALSRQDKGWRGFLRLVLSGQRMSWIFRACPELSSQVGDFLGLAQQGYGVSPGGEGKSSSAAAWPRSVRHGLDRQSLPPGIHGKSAGARPCRSATTAVHAGRLWNRGAKRRPWMPSWSGGLGSRDLGRPAIAATVTSCPSRRI